MTLQRELRGYVWRVAVEGGREDAEDSVAWEGLLVFLSVFEEIDRQHVKVIKAIIDDDFDHLYVVLEYMHRNPLQNWPYHQVYRP